jgi:pseudouridine-5'-phosphate glycosidase
MNRFIDYLDISAEVLGAMRSFKPIVALESTIISHGMPYPENISTAVELENIVRENGATPATIAIIKGRIKIGLSKEELELLASSKEVVKVSRRDIPSAIALNKTGATTVAATMIFAQLAGIRTFATGGIGGVHRGAQETFDISADLTELAQTNVAVVCSGVKSILDIAKTLEKLETLGVPVLGFKIDEFPSFYTRKSGLKVDNRFETPHECASIMKAKWDLNLDGGIVVANAIPFAFEANQTMIDNAIIEALADAKTKLIKGKEVTPFLLTKIKELTGGESLDANIALVKSNAALAAQIAVEYNNLTEN